MMTKERINAMNKSCSLGREVSDRRVIDKQPGHLVEVVGIPGFLPGLDKFLGTAMLGLDGQGGEKENDATEIPHAI